MAQRRIQVVSAAIARGERYLITQRTDWAVLPLLWEFPGGRVEEGESHTAALQRELRFRVGVDARIGEKLSSTEREYDDYVVELHLYSCEIGDVEPEAKGVKDLRWVTSKEFEDYEFTPADQASMDALLFGRDD